MGTIRKYGFYGFIRLLRDRLVTKVFFYQSRLIRMPYYIRGRSYIDFGQNLTTGVNVRLDAFPREINSLTKIISFGSNVQLNDYVHIGAIERIEIGNDVLIASKVFITDHNHGNYSGNIHSDPDQTPISRELVSSKVIIEDNVWIGEHACILPGVTIGKGSIIGAMSVVNRNIPPYSIAVGSPAKVIKKFNLETKIWDLIK